MKQVAIISGGDWADASCTHISLPDDVQLDACAKEYIIWKQQNKYMSFDDWLRKFKGATDSTVEVLEEP